MMYRIWLFTVLLSGSLISRAATLTVTSTSRGPAPSIVGYNAGHFIPTSNTADWWRYSGVNGVRVFITPGLIEPSDDIPGRGDGVTDEPGFLARRNALRADPLDSTFINWSYIKPKYGLSQQHGSNLINVDYTCGELRKIGVGILVCLTASEAEFPILDANDWAGKWELWQHYYAEAFYLGREYKVQRFQMYNEPNHNNSIGMDSYIARLQLISDAVQCAQADLERIYGGNLQPQMFAPVTAGSANSTYPSWGKLVITNRHVDFLGTSNPSFSLLGHYNYHEYNSEPVDFGARLASLHSLMQTDMSPEVRLPTTISEYNVHTASTFATLTNLSLDSPSKYARLGAIVSSLANNGIDEMYCFKFSQTLYNETIPIKKNGTHYVDNTNAPYNIGGITRAGDVYRLWARTARHGGNLLSVQKGPGTSGLTVTGASDDRYLHLFSANYSVSGVPQSIDTAAWNLPVGQVLALREVSEVSAGGIRCLLTNQNGGLLAPGEQLSNSVWLLSAPRASQSTPIVIPSSADIMAADGTNRTKSYAGTGTLVVENSLTDPSRRSVAYLKFNLPLVYKPDIQFAVLMLHVSAGAAATPAQAHVYGITNTAWTEQTLRWTNGPNLAQFMPAGPSYTNNFILGSGASSFMAAELVSDPAISERLVDVTDYIGQGIGTNVAFLVARELRFHGEQVDGAGLSITSTEGDPSHAPRLLLIRSLDSDSDGIGDASESSVFGTDPADADTDDDGAGDGAEILALGTDPGSVGNVAPTIINQPLDASVAAGASAVFSVLAHGTAPLSYQWFFNGTNLLSAAVTSTLNLPSVGTNDAGQYSVRVWNAFGAVTSSAVALEVTLPAPPPVDPNAVYYEPFVYEPGTPLSGQGGWILNGGTSGTSEAGNLSALELRPPVGNRLTWGSASMSLRLPLGTNLTTGDFYFSFLLRIDSLSSLPSVGTLAGLTTDTGTDFVTKLNIRSDGAGGYNLGTSKLGGTTYGDWAAESFSTGETVFVVGRYRFQPGGANDTCDLWLNPAPLTFGGASPPQPSVDGTGQGGADISQVNRFFFRGGGPAKVVSDELRLGFSWSSVTTPVPPTLTISLENSQVVVRWPGSFTGYRLQSCGDPASGAWLDADPDPILEGETFRVSFPASPAAQYHRLAR